MKEFTVNLNAGIKSFSKYWNFCVGSCHAATALRADWQEQIKKCHQELGFRYVRFHGLFGDDMNVVSRPLPLRGIPLRLFGTSECNSYDCG